MTRTSHAILAALVVLAALVGGVGHVGATADSQVGATTDGVAPAGAAPSASATVAQEDCSFPVTLTDASGTEVTLEEEPETVVTLGASSAQTVWEIGEAQKVVGMPVEGTSTSYLEGYSNRTHVLDGTNVDLEAVTDLDPDLVIAPDIIASEGVQALRDAGHTVYRENDASSVEDVRGRTQTTGQLLGACDAADETVEWMDERLATVEDAVEDEDRPSVFYWLGGGYTAGSATFQQEGLEIAGAENSAANMGIERSGPVEAEAIVAEDPDYILVTEGTELPEDHPIQQTTAAQEDAIVTVDGNDWNQAAPRMVLAIEEITQQLHNESYQAAASEEESSDSLPGFGVPVAIVALLSALVALRRQA